MTSSVHHNGLGGKHWRAIIGLFLMACGIVGYGTVVFRIGQPPADCAATWLQLIRQYGFPALLLLGGYNLFHKDALAEIAAAWKARA